MNRATQKRITTWIAVLLPAVVLALVGSAHWWLEHLKGPPPHQVTPYVVPALVGLVAGVCSRWIIRGAFPREREREQLHLTVSILITGVLVATYCSWWGQWVFRLAYWLEGTTG